MTELAGRDRPYFIDDPAPAGGVPEVDPGAPWLYVVAAIAIAVTAVYYLAVFASGPRDSWRHSFDRGRATWTELRPQPRASASGQPVELTP